MSVMFLFGRIWGLTIKNREIFFNKINIKVSANSISDLMVKLLQDSSNPEVVQEQSSTNIFNNQ